ncbi:MAG: response regulator [Burkholderiaceae bacterium]|nr:MAG: response regulator [Burkholderiaceae bacterium]
MNQAELHPALLARADTQASILVVDDTPANLSLLSGLLSPRWRVRLAPSGAKALDLVRRQAPDLIVLDVMMPEMDGYEVCRRLKADPATRDIPVLFLTALSQPEDETRGFACGGADFIHKPFNPATVLSRVATQLEAKAWRDALHQRNAWLQQELSVRLAEVEQLRDATLHVMISFAEFRDEDTGFHVRRTQEYVRTLARWLADQPGNPMGLDADRIEDIDKAAPLHDIGKVAIPDRILLKPGRLTPDEFTVIKTHARIGADTIAKAMAKVRALHADDTPAPDADEIAEPLRALEVARTIALSHHEHWDGNGYPDGLAGEAIPLPARLMAVADVFDALTGPRPYKTCWPVAEALAYIHARAGQQFDPVVCQALGGCEADFAAVAVRLRR